MNWTPIGLIGLAVFMFADLLVFRTMLPSHTAESTMLRLVNVLSWAAAVLLLLVGLTWIIL